MSLAGAARADVMVQVSDIAQSFSESAPPLTPPLVIDKTFSVLQVGNGRASVDSGQQLMRASFSTPVARNPDGSIYNLGVYGIEAKLTDHFVFGNAAVGQIIPMKFIASGTMTLPATDIQGDNITGTAQVSVSSLPGITGTLFDQVALTTSPGAALQGIPLVMPGTIPVDLLTDFSFKLDATLARDITFDLRISGGNGAALDFSHTAQVIFDLPPGVTVTSDGGFFESGPLETPEPSSIVSLGLALILLGAISWRRRRQLRASITRQQTGQLTLAAHQRSLARVALL
jgi:hypothetical protein